LGGFYAASKEQAVKRYRAARGNLKKLPPSAYGEHLPAGQKP